MRQWPFEAQGKRVASGKQAPRVARLHKFWFGYKTRWVADLKVGY
jgi:hypothetical protein